MQKKTCNECNQSLNLWMFDLNPTGRGGYSRRCKKCIAAYNKRRYDRMKKGLTPLPLIGHPSIWR